MSFASDVFFTNRNLKNLVIASVATGIVATGQTFCILSAGIDLSISSLVSLNVCLLSGICQGQENMLIPVLALTLLISLFVGFCNGFIIIKTGVNPLIVTLGMMSIVQGVAFIYTKAPIGEIAPSMQFLAWGKIGPVPFPFILLGVVIVTGIFVLKKTPYGRYVYSTGGNEAVAILSGIKTHRVKIATYMISSFCAFLCSCFLVSRMGQGDPIVGEPFLFDSIVPVLIGGTSFSGGVGGVVGTTAGVFILTMLKNAMNLLDISTYWQWMVEGVIIVTAVAMYSWKEKKVMFRTA
jgi:ribose/xylose/arabinose/galactoside ABC-type transport system permease subunit